MPKNPPHVSSRRAVSPPGTLLAAFGTGTGRRPRWIALDLRAVCEVASVEAVFEAVYEAAPLGRTGSAYPAVRVETSTDGAVWRPAGETAAGPGAGPAVRFDDPVAARWLRLTPLPGGGSGPARLAGLRVHGTRAAAGRSPAVGWAAWAAQPLRRTEPAAGLAPEPDGDPYAVPVPDIGAAPGEPADGGWWSMAAGWDLVLDDRAGAVTGAVASAVGAARDGRLPAAAPGTEVGVRRGERLLPQGAFAARPRGARERRSWWYRRQFVLPAAAFAGSAPGAGGDGRLWLEVEGLGHAAEVWLDGRRIGALPHPFARAEFDVSEAVREAGGRRGPHALAVRLTPAPQPAGPDTAAAARAPRCPDARLAPQHTAPSARGLAAELGSRVRLRAAAGEAAPVRFVLSRRALFATPARVGAGPAAPAGATARRPVVAPFSAGRGGFGAGSGRAWWPAETRRDVRAEPSCEGLPAAFVRAVEERLGVSTSQAAFARRARFVDYECLRAVVEAEAQASRFRPGGGYGSGPGGYGLSAGGGGGGGTGRGPVGWTDAGRFGARKAAEPLHVQASPADGAVAVVNRTPHPVRGAVVTAQLHDLGGRPIGPPVTRTMDVGASAVGRAFTVPFTRSLPATHLLRLTLAGADGRTLSANDYWRYRTPTDLRALNGLPQVPLSLRTTAAGPSAVTAEVANRGGAPAALVRLSLGGQDTACAADNFLWLLPGEARTVTLSWAGDDGVPPPPVAAEAYNAARVTA
ncbi:hypothetical protein V2S66_28815 [Streptomyces sp. V4-01]|uniref:F5/8 type C domain-containing protein n=1 Tax=Actinacidiphila polyblastidii TaxID=3110430 RepID=A0ABU7PL36_9ACTN|nr:hypothetical protein [Streptomyces sp. V4-01]